MNNCFHVGFQNAKCYRLLILVPKSKIAIQLDSMIISQDDIKGKIAGNQLACLPLSSVHVSHLQHDAIAVWIRAFLDKGSRSRRDCHSVAIVGLSARDEFSPQVESAFKIQKDH